MHDIVTTAPSTANGARRGQRRPGWQRDRTCRIVIVVVNQYLPAALGCRSGGGDVAAEVDEHATASDLVDPRGAPIRGDRLRRGAEVEHYAMRHRDDPVVEA